MRIKNGEKEKSQIEDIGGDKVELGLLSNKIMRRVW